jgi:hypothetical protein
VPFHGLLLIDKSAFQKKDAEAELPTGTRSSLDLVVQVVAEFSAASG